MNTHTLFIFLLAALPVWGMAQTYQVPVSEEHEPMQEGKFQPTWESLSQYQIPEWFKNAKFGIWAHWGPQCVEGSGDWMAREMYIEGSKAYEHHVKNYGHPSEVGFKDILPLFKAERWQPDSLVAYYKSLGAQYFFALGNHHDNFDLWDSPYQPWNSQNIGPHRDILAEWASACHRQGLRFGVSLHADHAWSWYEPAQRYDQKGRYAGKYYDGKLTTKDGKGKWWEGYDPQQLYAQNHPLSDRSWSNNQIHKQWAWGNGVCLPTQEFVTNFYDRTLDVINRYEPDLLYFDVTVLPFYPVSDAGLKIAAHMYNRSIKTHKGKNEAVIFGKILSDEQRQALVWDVERGAPNTIMEQPWQSCSCIGGWHYNTDIYNRNHYKSATTIVKLLVDIVSKNGNLLLSVPLRADGTFDEKEKAILDEFGAWMRVNREAIFDTRPWKIFGEGPIAESNIELNAQGFNESAYAKATSREIRFTQTDRYIYAVALAWPSDGRLVIGSLATGNPHHARRINRIDLLGHGKVSFTQTADGLIVNLPSPPAGSIAPVLRIRK